ncbi:hypothetical protein H0H92_008433, partial [Tricholoma furcatifolium]
MFARGATPGKVKTWSYNEEDEDFTKDATFLDIWVLDQLTELLQNATRNPVLNAELRSDKVVFFLHLLGLDTTGHSYRPHSKEYMNNIQVVDKIVRETEALINDFYGDQETSFIFTADHGMSVIGNHGDGDPDNTRTPLIAWGSGIRGPLPDSNPSSHDAYSEPWGLSHLFRRDVEQADLAALMAALLGINWPVNSVGVLPDVDPALPGYLSPKKEDETLARAALVNAKVILEQYTTKHELKKSQTLFYKPFIPLEGHDAPNANSHRIKGIAKIERLIDHNNWTAARLESAKLIKAGLSGLHYLQTYERLLIRGIVTAAYIGWAAYASLYIFRPLDFEGPKQASGSTVFVHASAILTLFLLQATKGLHTHVRVGVWKGALSAVLIVVVLQAMVIAYTHRFIWSIGFVVIGVVWPITWSWKKLGEHFLSVCVWGLLCLAAAIFPILSVEKKESLTT